MTCADSSIVTPKKKQIIYSVTLNCLLSWAAGGLLIEREEQTKFPKRNTVFDLRSYFRLVKLQEEDKQKYTRTLQIIDLIEARANLSKKQVKKE